jgi:hypothetical protein
MNAEADERNDWGFPPIEVTAHERSNQTTNVDQSVNKALPWVAFSWFLSGGAIVGLILVALLVPQLIDSRVSAQLSKAQADMHLAETNALLAKDRTDKIAAALEARGLIKLENH